MTDRPATMNPAPPQYDPRRLAVELVKDGGWTVEEVAQVCNLDRAEVEALAVEADHEPGDVWRLRDDV